MIQKNGDWSDDLITHFNDIKKSTIKVNFDQFKDYSKQEILDILMNANPGKISKDREEACNILFPNLYISQPITAPAQLASERENLIMVGGGSGIAPFLGFLDDQ